MSKKVLTIKKSGYMLMHCSLKMCRREMYIVNSNRIDSYHSCMVQG